MTNKFFIKIVTPEKVFEEQEIDRLTFLSSEGEVVVLPHHVEYLANIEISVLSITKDGKEKHYAVGGGAIHFNETKNLATLTLNSIIAVEDIDVAKSRHLQEEAERKLKTELSRLEHKEEERELKKALNELFAKGKYRE